MRNVFVYFVFIWARLIIAKYLFKETEPTLFYPTLLALTIKLQFMNNKFLMIYLENAAYSEWLKMALNFNCQQLCVWQVKVII